MDAITEWINSTFGGVGGTIAVGDGGASGSITFGDRRPSPLPWLLLGALAGAVLFRGR